MVGTARDVLEKWKKEDAFGTSLRLREGAPEFIFFEGPPSANGMPGIHHVMARSIKDAVCRYKTQSGYKVRRRAGWDTHGLPVELGVEKKLGITKEDIGRKISVEDYNRTCREEVMKYTAEWRTLTERIGYWVDMDDPYITYDNRYIETLWWLLKQIYSKGLLYKGKSIQPYSPAAGTGLSSHELNQPGCYRDVKDTTCIAQFKVTGVDGLYFLAWTTTPWTLPSNTALCVGPRIDYVKVRSANPYSGEECTYIVAKDLVESVFSGKTPYEVLPGVMKGTELEGMRYEQLIPWFRPDEGAFRVILGDYVSTEEGTGVVHIAPTFGADDAKVARDAGVPALTVIDANGDPQAQVDYKGRFCRIEDLDPDYVRERVDASYREWSGRYVKNAYDDSLPADAPTLDVDLCVMLKKEGKAFKIEKHVHSYPHCWRTDKPVIYYPLNSWFIRTTAVRDEMIRLNDRIVWKPESTGTGRFGKWLENIQDWNLSRSRYWGTPLPVWRTEDGREELCIGSLKELYAEIDKAVEAGFMKSNPLRDKGFDPDDMGKENYGRIDLHRPYVDEIFLVSPSGKKMTRETDLIDVWFDSGSMPYAQTGLRGKDTPDFGCTADFIAEGVDQTRGWFYTLHAIHTMVSGTPAFRRVISNGLVLDRKGEKMSKRLDDTHADLVCCGIRVHEGEETYDLLYDNKLLKQIARYNAAQGDPSQLDAYALEAVLLTPSIHPAPWNKMVRRDLLIQHNISFPDLTFGEDRCWVIHTTLKSHRIEVINDPLYHYILHSDSLVNRFNEKYAISSIELLKFSFDLLLSKEQYLKLYDAWLYHFWDTLFTQHDRLSPEL